MPHSGSYPRGVKLGVDVGTVRVGLAACDPDGILATPFRTLSRDAKKNSDVGVIVKQAAERGAVQIFVGLPRTLKGQEGPSARMASDYAGLLAAALQKAGLDVPVHLIDERLSTVSAHRSLHDAGMSSKDHRKVVDQLAAAGILQHAIEMQKARGQDVGRRVHAPALAVESTQPGGAGADTASGPAKETDSQRAEGNREPGQS
ncbi:Holliday junction DNA helicase RuvA [Arthrobacter sp. SW1]|uniref:Holliday junction resolvase RuvX n=1 Tax=Arthrobacter sp. SW1 TaxID=1920889 RepID=UPI000877C79A|nr:Holliday junction resolvase RuvX [Arthrobacter sp. SW1]OFI38175.1 Holliday junction DNA helicase RuvA [Arthrobacter sp. SW1]